jgi:hypothetical protein
MVDTVHEPLPKRAWGVLVYIVGDQDGLSPEEAADINKVAQKEAQKLVRAARGLDDVYLSVHVDLTGEDGSWVYRVPGERQPEKRPEDRASLQNLVDFLEAEKAERPSDHTMVILWGHSGGPLGLFQDPEGGPGTGTIRLSELGKILPAFRASPQSPIDILLVKSCYMATLEATWEVERIVDYMICSQARVPMQTWTIWEDVFEQIGKDKAPASVARDILHAVERHYADARKRNDRDEIPFSLLRPGQVLETKPLLNTLFRMLWTHRDDAAVVAAVESARPDSGGDKALLDVRQLCVNLVNVGYPELAHVAVAVDDALSPAVIVENTPATSRYGGIGLFHFPRNALLRAESFANVVTENVYSALSFAKDTEWVPVAFPSLTVDTPAQVRSSKADPVSQSICT